MVQLRLIYTNNRLYTSIDTELSLLKGVCIVHKALQNFIDYYWSSAELLQFR